MPLTPFHLGPGLLSGILTLRFFNIYAFLVGSVIMDIEPLTLIIIKKCYRCPHHPFLHTIVGAIVGSFAVVLLVRLFAKPLNKISLWFKVKQKFSFSVLYISSLAAWLLHILFDAITHSDVFPFWPLKYNPILIGTKAILPLHLILTISGIIGLVLLYKLYKNSSRSSPRSNSCDNITEQITPNSH